MKKTVRNEAIRRRDIIPFEVRKGKDAVIRKRLLSRPEFISAKRVLFYASFRSEVETLSMIVEALGMGKRVILPWVDRENRVLRLYEIRDISELDEGYMRIPEPVPSEERLVCPDDVDLVVIPGAAFDRSGNRLGYGAGYYDILLSGMKKTIPIIAPAYDEQIVDSIPSAKHDVKVDMIITDKEIILIR